MPTEATVSHVIVSKYADHLPLYRQAQIYSRQGVDLDRSTLAAWVGRATFELNPVYDALLANLKRSSKLFMDETTAPVLDPGRRKTKTGYFWALTDHRVVRTLRVWPLPMRQDVPAIMAKTFSKASLAPCKLTAMRATIGWSSDLHRMSSLPTAGRMRVASCTN